MKSWKVEARYEPMQGEGKGERPTSRQACTAGAGAQGTESDSQSSRPPKRATRPNPGGAGDYGAAGRGSADKSRAASPFWVMMEISRVARSITAERSGSNSDSL